MIFYTVNCMIVSPIFLSTAMPGSLYACTTSESSKTSQPLGISESIGCGVRTGNIKLVNAVSLDESRKLLVCQGVALYLRKNMIGYNVQLRNQLCTTGAGLEGSRSRRKVVIPFPPALPRLHLYTPAPTEN